jgi:hypothetical protein
MLHFQQRLAALALVHNGVERISFSALRVDTLKPGSVWHRHLSSAARPGILNRDSHGAIHNGLE